MNTIGTHGAAAGLKLSSLKSSRENNLVKALSVAGNTRSANTQTADSDKTKEVHDKFTQFVGEAFYGQMFKAMRSTVPKPAYFHGGRAEEAFQGQLDQTMSEQMTKATASKFADPMFDLQFPGLAQAEKPSDLSQLMQLRRQ